MKILFICGSLDPGKDGVGDYSRRLAGELLRQGHQTKIVALYDKGIKELHEEQQYDGSTAIAVLRLPQKMDEASKYKKVKDYINHFDPLWLSLQYVPFSFHKKGMPFGLASELKKIGIGHKWHIMFHELWVGMRESASFKHILIAKMQRVIVKNLLLKLHSKVNHTQSPFYKKLLLEYAINVDVLPLFSNLPVNHSGENSLKKIEPPYLNEISLVIFAGIHFSDRVDKFLNMLLDYQKNRNRKIVLKAIGRNGTEIKKWKEACTRLGIPLKVYGEQDSFFVVRVLKESTIGITTTALPMIEKSGAVAAMRECGLPVICIADDWKPRETDYQFVPKGIFKLEKNVMDSCLNFDNRLLKNNNLMNVTLKFIVDLA